MITLFSTSIVRNKANFLPTFSVRNKRDFPYEASFVSCEIEDSTEKSNTIFAYTMNI